MPDEKSESLDVKEEPFSEGSQENDRERRSHGSDSEAGESEKDSGTEDDESETKYFRDAESDDVSEENESLSDLDSWDDQIVKQEDESANNQSGQEISNRKQIGRPTKWTESKKREVLDYVTLSRITLGT